MKQKPNRRALKQTSAPPIVRVCADCGAYFASTYEAKRHRNLTSHLVVEPEE